MKIIGTILILFASVCACVLYERKEKQKISSAIEACDFIKYIRAQIEYFSCPIDKIFNSYEPKGTLIEALISGKHEEASRLLSKEDFKIINTFFLSLGKGLKNEELSLCSYSLSELERSIEKKKSEYPSKVKVFRAMALFCAFCIIIMLI